MVNYVNETDFAIKINKLLEEKKLTRVGFAKYCGVSIQTVCAWFNGKNRPDFEILKKMSKYFNVSIDYLLDNDVESVSSDDVIKLPVINFVQAGKFMDINELQVDDYIPVPKEIGKHCFVLKVKGDSMSPKFQDGDLVIVDPFIQPTTGLYVIASTEHDEKATFKKYRERYTESGEMFFELVPLNPDYPTFNSRQFNIQIKGVVKSLIRNV